jgi:hypothetical protein
VGMTLGHTSKLWAVIEEQHVIAEFLEYKE